MDAMLSILVALAGLGFIERGIPIAPVVRRLIADRRSRLAREARQARRYAPIDRPLLP